MSPKISITTGDEDGVGVEVAQKAILKLPLQKAHLFLWRSKKNSAFLKLAEKKSYLTRTSKNLSEALELSSEINQQKNLKDKRHSALIEIVSSESPPRWVETSARACLEGKLGGLCTGPLSKELIVASGMKDLGHTEILQRLSGVSRIFQGYVGTSFNVVLMTAHTPLRDVSFQITESLLNSGYLAAQSLLHWLPRTQQKKPMSLLGLNPHASEDGLIGREENEFLKPFCKSKKIVGPLSPDAAFLEKNWDQFSVYLACYHDQGLIPFKMIHEASGVHVSLGLPFPRTSVDHGTAKEIFGKNKANPQSLIDALQLCIKMVKAKELK